MTAFASQSAKAFVLLMACLTQNGPNSSPLQSGATTTLAYAQTPVQTIYDKSQQGPFAQEEGPFYENSAIWEENDEDPGPVISRSRSGGFEPEFSLGNRSKRRRSVNFRLKEKKILDSVLGPDRYDRRIRPGGVNSTEGKSSTIVNVNIYLRSINDIDDYKMEYSVQLTFREQWNDERLKFDDLSGRLKYLTLTDPGKVWMPDTFFRNEKTGHFHAILVNNVYVRVFPNGDVLFSIRISLTLACPMNLKLYPMDRQTCSLRIASYGYTTDDITYLWKKLDPVQIPQGLSLPRFSIEKYSSSYCNVKTNTGEYSCLSVDLVFKRQFSYYLITIYVPGCMLVIVSWVSFWLDPHAVPARVALGVTTLLTMSTQTASINSALPPVAYTKAIDVWQGVCVTFVFSALLEYALVNYALRANRAYRTRLRRRRGGGRRGGAYRYTDDDDGGGNYFDDDDDCYDDDDDDCYDDDDDDDAYGGYGSRGHRGHRRYSSGGGRQTERRSSSYLFGNHLMPRGSDGGNGVNRRGCVYHRQSSNNLLFAHLGAASSNRGNSILLGRSAPTTSTNSSQQQNSSPPSKDTTVSSPPLADEKVVYAPLPTRRFAALPHPMEKAKRIDVASRILFPAIFAVFNLAYWIYYLVRASQGIELTQEGKKQ